MLQPIKNIKASVVLSSDRTLAIADDLRQLGWRIECCSQANECEIAAARSGACTVLIHTSSVDLPGLQASIERSALRWVALVDSASRHNDVLRRLILEQCSDYLLAPLDARIVANILEGLSAGWRSRSRRPEPERCGTATKLLGNCAAMAELNAELQQAALLERPVLIHGETGTGKGLAARAVHHSSKRADMPFVVVNCGGTSSRLFLSELFGYERDVFAGEGRRKLGKVELAAGGTLFLDEICDSPPEADAALSRFLREGTFVRLGGSETLAANVRVIAATNFKLHETICKSESRPDLLQRLFNISIEVPPLRYRGRDIELIARCVLSQLTADSPNGPKDCSSDAIQAMHLYHWPGNVRELINKIWRGVMVAPGSLIHAAEMDLVKCVPKLRGFPSLSDIREAAERDAVQRALVRHRYSYTEAARELAISRDALVGIIQTLGLIDFAKVT